MKSLTYILSTFLLCVCITSVCAQQFSDFSKEEIQSDVAFLYSQLKYIHPNAKNLDAFQVGRITNDLHGEHFSESDAFFIFNGMLKLLNDGHSAVKFSPERTREIIRFGSFFPYELQFFDSTAVVKGTIGSTFDEFERREIFKINNIPIKTILEDLAVVAMVDGEQNSSVKEWLSEDFWFYFTIYNGFRNSYSITYLEEGREFHEIAKAMNRNEFLKTSILDDFKAQPIELNTMKGMDVLSISNFEQKSARWWKRRLKEVFAELEEKNSEQLVLDLRSNGGGQENLQNILLESFGISPSDKYELEILKTMDFSKVNGVQNHWKERIKSIGLEKVVFKEEYARGYKKRKHKKQKEPESLYTGELYVLIDGSTFSCASDAAAILKENYKRTQLVGTETRGSGKENYAGYFVHVELPNTGLIIRIPRVKYVLKSECSLAQNGVIPDIKVSMDKSDVQRNIDTQLTYLLDYFQKQNDSVKN